MKKKVYLIGEVGALALSLSLLPCGSHSVAHTPWLRDSRNEDRAMCAGRAESRA